MSAILFGSISTLADTSELQREAFNRAFAEHGLNWRWERDDYRAMLDKSGGAARIAAYAKTTGDTVDAKAVHATKSQRFREGLASSSISARPGVAETIRGARDAGMRVGLVTTTAKENVTALLEALPDISASDFDVVLDRADVERPKPDREVYDLAVQRLHEDRAGCVAIEDNVEGAKAAADAGVVCVAFPNQNTAEHDFGTAAEQSVDHLELDELRQLIR